jgi:hypothetical protein
MTTRSACGPTSRLQQHATQLREGRRVESAKLIHLMNCGLNVELTVR